MGKPGTRSNSPLTRTSQKQQKEDVANKGGNGESETASGTSGQVKEKVQIDWETMKTEFKGMIDSTLAKFKEEITESMNSRFDHLESQFNEVFDEVKEDISQIREDMKDARGELTEVKTKVSDLEDGMNEHSVRLDEVEDNHKKDLQKLRNEFDEKLAKTKVDVEKQYRALERQILLLEKHDRKYSLLLYGMPQEKTENIYDVVRKMFTEDLQIRKTRVEEIYFANAHRLYSTASGPKPIIVNFLTYDDRELVFSHASKLRGTRMRILADLPVVMKNERHRLAKLAYDIRQKEKVETRIRDKDLDVWLEVKVGGEWVKRNV